MSALVPPPAAPHTLATIAEVAAWLAIVERTASDLEAAAAKGCLLVAYSRAAARAEHRDEHEAALDALHYVRAAHGEDVATDAARAAGLDLAALLDQEREDNAQRARDEAWESCVPWGKP